MIIDMIEPKRVSRPLSFLERFRMIKDCFDDDAGVNALLNALKTEESKSGVLNHYYAYIAAADRDKHKYICNLVHLLVDPEVSKRLDPNLPELYVCRSRMGDSLLPMRVFPHIKRLAEQGYSMKDNS